MADPHAQLTGITPDVLEAAHILLMMKHGMRAFLEAQQARCRIPYLYYASLNPAVSAQLHYFSSHGIAFSSLYDIAPMPAAYQFPLAHAQSFSLPQQEAYYGMLSSSHCMVGPPREQSVAGTVPAERVAESEKGRVQPAAKKARLSSTSTGSPEQTAGEKQDAKRKRKNLTKEQLEILESVYEKDKYPHVDDRIKLEKPTNLTEDRIQVWFQNRRAKDRKKMEAEKLQQCFENSQNVTVECKKNGKDTRKVTLKTELSPDRKNSGSETSDNER